MPTAGRPEPLRTCARPSDEPAVVGDDARCPSVDAWQRAADGGAARRSCGRRDASCRSSLDAGLGGAAVDAPRRARGLVPRRPAQRGAAACSSASVSPRTAACRRASSGFATPPHRPTATSSTPMSSSASMLEIDDADEVVWGIVHSHVASPPAPSATDVGPAPPTPTRSTSLLVRDRAAPAAGLDDP